MEEQKIHHGMGIHNSNLADVGHAHKGGHGHGAEGEAKSPAVLTYEGWFSIHATYRIDFQAWKSWEATKQAEALSEFKAFIAELEVGHEAEKSSYALYNVAGQKGDLLVWFLEPTLEEVTARETQLRKLAIGAVLIPTASFVSVIEVSNYFKADINHPKVQARLYPKVPRLKYMCFYPMSKQRHLTDNWYMTSREERGRMMRSHGQIGKKYEDTIKEFTTGACGLDDWEWGITLMSDDPVQFKKIVNEMRFDEVSARFGIFGPFTVGTILDEAALDHLFA